MDLIEGRCWCGSTLVGQPHNCVGTKERVEQLIAEIHRLQDAELREEHLLDLLRATKMKHGICQPRERKACTACNAQEELDAILAKWKGPVLRLS